MAKDKTKNQAQVEDVMLTVELVPKTAWYNNLRSLLSKGQWDKLRKTVYKRAGYKCEVCGGVGEKWPVEAHEIWSYDDVNKIQKLEGIVALCPMCHKVKHIGLAKLNGDIDIVMAHLAKVNGWNIDQAHNYIAEQFRIWAMRSKYEWETDISIIDSWKSTN